MAQVLAMNDIKKAIVDYISDERKTQAVLLNGEWGCGKTFFVKECLMPALEKLPETRVFKVSLYGISDVEMIQDMIYAEWLESYIEKKTDRMGAIGHAVNKGIGVLGKTAIHALENKLGTEDGFKKLSEMVMDGDIGKNMRNIIIFDDVERCRVDIIQLMGFLNNLTENSGFKLILIANEKEVNRQAAPSEDALKYLVALNNRIRTVPTKENTDNANVDVISIDELRNITLQIFGEESVYEKTREKLIGLTIPYSVSITESFEAIIKKYISTIPIQDLVLKNKDSIIKILDENDHRNLRTLISACIVIEDILSTVDANDFSEIDILYEEINTVIIYSVYSAIRRSTGKPLFQWPRNIRYTSVNSNLMKPDITKIYGYAFVDEYWKTQCVDKTVILRDLHERIDYLNEVEQSKKQSQEHNKLALYKLKDWYLLKDEDVKELVSQMKQELGENKYKPYEFREIVCTLMRINNPNFGMNSRSETQDSGDVVYESSEASQFLGMTYAEKEAVSHQYIDWDKIDISEFVTLMVSYFEGKEFSLTNDMIRVLSEDKQFVYNYRILTMPLLDLIEYNDKISKDENGICLSEMPWNESLEISLREKRQEYISQGRFFSLFDYNKLIEHISSASAEELHNFCDAIRSVYSFSNLANVYSSDLDIVNNVIEYIEKNNGSLINQERSRTKEIAMIRLTKDLKRYSNALGYNQDVV